MPYKSYVERLRDPRWQRKRLEIMQRAEFLCESCDASDKTLNVHHKLYRKGANPWDYEDFELECLCEDCHEKKHKIRAALDAAIVTLEPWYMDELLGFAEGLAAKVDCQETPLKLRNAEHADGVSRAFAIACDEDVLSLMDAENCVSLEMLFSLLDRRRQ